MKAALLQGVRVLDLSRVLAGPLCAQYLGDMGADIVKIEDTREGDDTRTWPVFRQGQDGARTSAVFVSANRNKRAIAIDLKSDEGRALVHRLVGDVDVVVESFAPGVAQRLGVDANTLRSLNPRLIHCSITGFGSVGPLKNGKGYDLILQAFTGMLSITGEEGGPPTRSPFSPVDQATGLHALAGILAALHARQATSEGCSIEASLFDTATAFLGYFLHNHWETGSEPARVGIGHPGLCPYGLFETADRPLILGVANDSLWRKFCALAGLQGKPEIEQLASNDQRVKRRVETNALVTETLRRHGRSHWFAILDEAGIPCSPLHTLGELAAHPHAHASGMLYGYEDPHFGPMKSVAQPLRFDGERSTHRLNAPLHGEHTEAILRDAGVDDATIRRLIAQGVVRTSDAPLVSFR